MTRIPRPRRHSALLLDLAFIGWASYSIISGRLVPAEIVALFHNDAPIAAVIEPAHEPPSLSPGIEAAPPQT